MLVFEGGTEAAWQSTYSLDTSSRFASRCGPLQVYKILDCIAPLLGVVQAPFLMVLAVYIAYVICRLLTRIADARHIEYTSIETHTAQSTRRSRAYEENVRAVRTRASSCNVNAVLRSREFLAATIKESTVQQRKHAVATRPTAFTGDRNAG